MWVTRRATDGSNVRWGPIVLANVFSSLVLLVLPSVTLVIKERFPNLEFELAPYQDALLWGSVGGCGVLFAASFFEPSLLRRTRAVPNQKLHLTAAALRELRVQSLTSRRSR